MKKALLLLPLFLLFFSPALGADLIENMTVPDCSLTGENFNVNFSIQDGTNITDIDLNVTSSYGEIYEYNLTTSSYDHSVSFNHTDSVGIYNSSVYVEENDNGTILSDTESNTSNVKWNCTDFERSNDGYKIGFWFTLLMLIVGLSSLIVGVMSKKFELVMLGSFILFMVGLMYLSGSMAMEGYNVTKHNTTIMNTPETENLLIKYSLSIIISIVGLLFLAILFLKYREDKKVKLF